MSLEVYKGRSYNVPKGYSLVEYDDGEVVIEPSQPNDAPAKAETPSILGGINKDNFLEKQAAAFAGQPPPASPWDEAQPPPGPVQQSMAGLPPPAAPVKARGTTPLTVGQAIVGATSAGAGAVVGGLFEVGRKIEKGIYGSNLEPENPYMKALDETEAADPDAGILKRLATMPGPGDVLSAGANLEGVAKTANSFVFNMAMDPANWNPRSLGTALVELKGAMALAKAGKTAGALGRAAEGARDVYTSAVAGAVYVPELMAGAEEVRSKGWAAYKRGDYEGAKAAVAAGAAMLGAGYFLKKGGQADLESYKIAMKVLKDAEKAGAKEGTKSLVKQVNDAVVAAARSREFAKAAKKATKAEAKAKAQLSTPEQKEAEAEENIQKLVPEPDKEARGVEGRPEDEGDEQAVAEIKERARMLREAADAEELGEEPVRAPAAPGAEAREPQAFSAAPRDQPTADSVIKELPNIKAKMAELEAAGKQGEAVRVGEMYLDQIKRTPLGRGDDDTVLKTLVSGPKSPFKLVSAEVDRLRKSVVAQPPPPGPAQPPPVQRVPAQMTGRVSVGEEVPGPRTHDVATHTIFSETGRPQPVAKVQEVEGGYYYTDDRGVVHPIRVDAAGLAALEKGQQVKADVEVPEVQTGRIGARRDTGVFAKLSQVREALSEMEPGAQRDRVVSDILDSIENPRERELFYHYLGEPEQRGGVKVKEGVEAPPSRASANFAEVSRIYGPDFENWKPKTPIATEKGYVAGRLTPLDPGAEPTRSELKADPRTGETPEERVPQEDVVIAPGKGTERSFLGKADIKPAQLLRDESGKPIRQVLVREVSELGTGREKRVRSDELLEGVRDYSGKKTERGPGDEAEFDQRALAEGGESRLAEREDYESAKARFDAMEMEEPLRGGREDYAGEAIDKALPEAVPTSRAQIEARQGPPEVGERPQLEKARPVATSEDGGPTREQLERWARGDKTHSSIAAAGAPTPEQAARWRAQYVALEKKHRELYLKAHPGLKMEGDRVLAKLTPGGRPVPTPDRSSVAWKQLVETRDLMRRLRAGVKIFEDLQSKPKNQPAIGGVGLRPPEMRPEKPTPPKTTLEAAPPPEGPKVFQKQPMAPEVEASARARALAAQTRTKREPQRFAATPKPGPPPQPPARVAVKTKPGFTSLSDKVTAQNLVKHFQQAYSRWGTRYAPQIHRDPKDPKHFFMDILDDQGKVVNSIGIHIDQKSISVNTKDFEASYGKGADPSQHLFRGVTTIHKTGRSGGATYIDKTAIIRLAQGANLGDLQHEIFHAAMKVAGITKPEYDVLVNQFRKQGMSVWEAEEKLVQAAEKIARDLDKYEHAKKFSKEWWLHNAMSLWRNIGDAVWPTGKRMRRRVLRKTVDEIRTGKIWSKRQSAVARMSYVASMHSVHRDLTEQGRIPERQNTAKLLGEIQHRYNQKQLTREQYLAERETIMSGRRFWNMLTESELQDAQALIRAEDLNIVTSKIMRLKGLMPYEKDNLVQLVNRLDPRMSKFTEPLQPKELKQLRRYLGIDPLIQAAIRARDYEPSKWRLTGRALLLGADFSKAMKASGDLSALRQGAWQFASTMVHSPIKSLSKGSPIRMMFKTAFSKDPEGVAKVMMEDMAKDPWYDSLRSMGLKFYDLGQHRAEQWMGEGAELAELFPGVKRSNLAFNTFLNKIRFDSAKDGFAFLAKNGADPITHAELYKNMVDWINISTGHGGWRALEDASRRGAQVYNDIARKVFWSPSFMYSRMQLINPANYATFGKGGAASQLLKSKTGLDIGKAGKVSRYFGKNITDPKLADLVVRRARMDSARAIGFMTGLMGTAWLANQLAGRDEPAPEMNWRSSDFLKTKFGKASNWRADTLAGLQQYMVLTGRILSGETKSSSGKIRSFGSVGGYSNRAAVVADFLAKKATPLAAAVMAAGSGLDIQGDDASWSRVLEEGGAEEVRAKAWEIIYDSISPMSVDDLEELYAGVKSQEISPLEAALAAGTVQLGVSGVYRKSERGEPRYYRRTPYRILTGEPALEKPRRQRSDQEIEPEGMLGEKLNELVGNPVGY